MSAQAISQTPSVAEALSLMQLSGQWRIGSNERQDLEAMCQVDTTTLLSQLVPEAQKLAHPPVSQFYVGAAMLTNQGNIYLGANQEFSGLAINQSIHAEQSAVCNLAHNQETQISMLAVSAAPCGHCRQFMAETNQGLDIEIYFPSGHVGQLTTLLPYAFTPKDLDNEHPMLSPRPTAKLKKHSSSLIIKPTHAITQELQTLASAKAIIAAQASYAPYTGSFSGMCLVTSCGQLISGRYLENAAFNPSFPAAQSAYIQLLVRNLKAEDVTFVVFAEHVPEASFSHLASAQLFTQSVFQGAGFEAISLTKTDD